MRLRMFKRADTENGFTLVEILVSLVILLILVMAFVPMFTFVAQAIASNKAKDVAIELATQKMEELRALPYVVLDSDQQIDATKPQLGLIDGEIDGKPPGSVEPTVEVSVNNRTFLVTTDITWGDENKSFKLVSVTVTAPGVFNEAVSITNRFDTMAAQEGIRVHPGSILVEVFDSEGVPLTESIEITIETSGFDAITESTTAGKVVFTDLPSGVYRVSARVPSDMMCHPDLLSQYDSSTRLLTEDNITVTYNKQAKVSFIMDYSAGIDLTIKDHKNSNISTNNSFSGGKVILSWYESDPASTLSIMERNITNNEISNGKLGSVISGLWPEGTYIISVKINKNITDGDFRVYNSYYNDNIQLNANQNKAITAVLPAPPVKVVLLGKDSYVDLRYNGWNAKNYVKTWHDKSGNDYHASNSTNSRQPRFKKDNPNKNQLMFENNDIYTDGDFFLDIPGGAECTNNFTVFVSAQPDQNHEQDAISNDPGNIQGTGGQKYLLYPTQKGTEAGMGISLGKNGVTVYEHGTSYMPAKARYDANLSDYHIIAVKYFQDTAGTVNPTPSIYVNGEHKTTGYPSNKSVVYSPLRIGGGDWGYYRGNLRAVVIYDSPVLDDANIKAVSQFLYDNYR